MRAVVEALLKDVDPIIQETMLQEYVPEEGTTETFTVSEAAKPLQNWQMLPEPCFIIIQWQQLRHENRSNKNHQES